MMSGRERDDRDSDLRRRRSGFDRESSPKKFRRDGKPETERVTSNAKLDVHDHKVRDQKHRRRLQDVLPLEAPSERGMKSGPGVIGEESEKKPNGQHEGSKRFSDPTDVPRSRSYFQHDERSDAGQVGRSFGRRAAMDRQWRDSKDDRNGRAADKSSTYDPQQRDEKLKTEGDNNAWRHDGYFKMEAEPAPPTRKRPAFREKKIPEDSENTEKATTEPTRSGPSDHPTLVSERKEERERHPRYPERSERPVLGYKKEALRAGSLFSRERYGGAGGRGGSYRGRERFSGRQGYRPSGTRVEKWKHDLYEEDDSSPSLMNEEDQIAKVEQLLAS